MADIENLDPITNGQTTEPINIYMRQVIIQNVALYA
jgi:hypothetical protein